MPAGFCFWADPARTRSRVVRPYNLVIVYAFGRAKEARGLRIPPLRERRDEIPALARHFLAHSAAEFKKGDVRVSEEAMRCCRRTICPRRLQLKGIDIPKTGQAGTSGVGLMVTKTVVVMGDSQITAPPGKPRDALLRAYDKKTGQQVGAVWMPAPQSGSPMTYMVDGKQYIVVAVSGGAHSGEYLAFSLQE